MTNEIKSRTILNTTKSKLTTELKAVQKLLDSVPDHQESIDRKTLLEKQLISIEKDIKAFRKIEKQEETSEKQEEKAEESEQVKWECFQQALKVYHETQMCFHKHTQPRYFYKKTYYDVDKKTKKDLAPRSELHMFTPASLSDNWIELESKTTQKYLKRMVFGKPIKIKNMNTGELTTYDSFPPRVYTKLANTRNIPDPETYNIIDLSGVMRPTGVPADCPPIIRCLLLSLSGNVWTDDDSKLPKVENYAWVKKWAYGVLVADIGNNMLPMPIFFGPGKVGKNAIFEFIFPRVLGKELVFVGLWENLDGNFNGFKLGKVFIYIDEIPSRDDWNKLKNLTGSASELVKQKYGPEFEIENTISIALGSNQHVYPLPIEDGRQMSRVSPIATNKDATFAENVYRYFESLGPGTIITLLEQQGIDTSEFNTDPYELGDKWLRNNIDVWAGAEAVQQLVDSLAGEFGQDTYVLNPLRGQDWDEIIRNRPNYLDKVVEYVTQRKIEIITISELYEIYQVVVGGNKNNQHFIKGQNGFSAAITPMLKEKGYDRKQQHRVTVTPKIVGFTTNPISTRPFTTQTTVFHCVSLTGQQYTQDYEQYIGRDEMGKSALIY